MSREKVNVQIRQQNFELLCERAVFWRETRTLFAADLHWGKTEVFHHYGIPVPKGVLIDDLKCLSRALLETSARRLLILGDLVHGVKGLTADVCNLVEQWRKQHPDVEICLIKGNHDRGHELPIEWGINLIDNYYDEGDFRFCHSPPDESLNTESIKCFYWCGHVHPVITLRGGGDSLRLPCFQIGSYRGLLPAFSAFTGGQEIKIRRGEQIFAIADEQVVAIS